MDVARPPKNTGLLGGKDPARLSVTPAPITRVEETGLSGLWLQDLALKDTFRADARLGSLATFALTADEMPLLGFGQYYLRAGRCHLARLAIAPGQRGRGLGGTLVRELCRIGSAELGVDTYSLFVLPGNERAIRLYERLGFAPARYPEPDPMFDDCVYMVATTLRN